jgi:translation elongation factor EF-Ts
VLGDQPFVIRPEAKQTVNQVIAATNKALGAGIAVTRFARLKVGEGAAA